jgi:TrmH family RNA methyltransferase
LPSTPDNLRVVVVRTRNPLNLGAAGRAMSNFGFLHLRVVQPYEIAFREARSAVGASVVMQQAEEFSSLTEAIADCSLVVGTTTLRNRQAQHPVYRLEHAADLIGHALATQRVALLFGSEKVGLSTEDLSYCHWLTHIPTREEHPSMNLGQAVAVCLYEVARTEVKPAQDPTAAPPPAPASDLERLTSTLLDTLRVSGYLREAPTELEETKVRRLIRRLHLDSKDAELLQGMLRQVLWKLRSQP